MKYSKAKIWRPGGRGAHDAWRKGALGGRELLKDEETTTAEGRGVHDTA